MEHIYKIKLWVLIILALIVISIGGGGVFEDLNEYNVLFFCMEWIMKKKMGKEKNRKIAIYSDFIEKNLNVSVISLFMLFRCT